MNFSPVGEAVLSHHRAFAGLMTAFLTGSIHRGLLQPARQKISFLDGPI